MPRSRSSMFASLLFAGLLVHAPGHHADAAPPASASRSEGVVNGVVKSSSNGKPIENAVVVLQCSCLAAALETTTDARGIYRFEQLPSGNYSVQVLAGKAKVSKLFQLPRDAKFRANFSIDPARDEVIEIVVEASPVASNPAASMTIGMEEAKQLPIGNSSARDFTAVVDISPTGSRDAAGISVAGITGAERYAEIEERPATASAEQSVSTFSIDVDTAAYSNVRRFLSQGQRPPADAVRIEELLNYFDYDYPPPKSGPFSVTTEVADCPWNPEARLLHIGVQGKPIALDDLPPRKLVFLIDVSGSMSSPDKLPLLIDGMRQLVATLRPVDSVAIVVYAGASGVVLLPTSGSDQAVILAALARLHAGGSTNGAAGIELAYELARQQFDEHAVNRVILASDGDFNVGNVSLAGLERLIKRERKSGVFLSVLGFGTGNLGDETMEMLADKGNGNYAYIDDAAEAHKVLVEQGGATLVTIAKDVKIQVEFDPKQVASYRLIGYENRALSNRDFANDQKDAGEIGAGHSVTALYEIVPRDGATGQLKLGELRLRHKAPNGKRSKLSRTALVDVGSRLAASSDDFRFAAAVAEFGLLLRGSPHAGTASWSSVASLAQAAIGADRGGYRRGFLDLVKLAAALP